MKIPVLLYHRVGPPVPGSAAATTLSPAKFARQVRLLSKLGFQGVRPLDILSWRRGEGVLPRKPVLFTFDDGYADITEHALPVLQRYGFSAAVYLVTRRLSARDDWPGWNGERNLLALMSSEQVRKWAARGIEFGGHTRTHRDLTSAYGEELTHEVEGCADDLRQLLGRRPISFAYPYGMYNAQVRALVRQHFEIAFTCDEGFAGDTDPHLFCRMLINPGDSLIEFASKVLYGRNPIGALRSRLRLRSRFREWGLLLGH